MGLHAAAAAAAAAGAVPAYLGAAPYSFFTFAGRHAGLQLASLCLDGQFATGVPAWPGTHVAANAGVPPSNGYTFHCWLSVDALSGCVSVEQSVTAAVRARAARLRLAGGIPPPVVAAAAPGSPPVMAVEEVVDEPEPHVLSVWDEGGRELSLVLVRSCATAGSGGGEARSAGGVDAGVAFTPCLRIQHQKHETEQLMATADVRLVPGEWYALTVVQEKSVSTSTSLFGRGLASLGVDFGFKNAAASASLFVNGRRVAFNNACRYPNFGTNVDDAAPATTPALTAASSSSLSTSLAMAGLSAGERGELEREAARGDLPLRVHDALLGMGAIGRTDDVYVCD
ncbi:hypothetical protein EON68_03545, partial [archaeon]